MDQPQRDPSPSSRLDTDLFCIGCGYNLRTLSLDAVCPECALPLRQSLLTGGQISWLRKVHRGLNLLYRMGLVFAVIAMIYAVMTIVAGSSNFFFIWSCLRYLTIPLGIIFTIGIFRVTGRTPYWNSPKLSPLASTTRMVGVLCIAGALARSALPMFFYDPLLRVQIYASGYLLELGNDCLLATFLFLLLAGLGLNVRIWWVLVLFFSGAMFVYSETTAYLNYRVWMQSMSGVRSTGISQPQWWQGLHILGTTVYVANNVLCVIYYRKCRSGVARLISSNPRSAAGEGFQVEPTIATSDALLGPGQSPYNPPDETASV